MKTILLFPLTYHLVLHARLLLTAGETFRRDTRLHVRNMTFLFVTSLKQVGKRRASHLPRCAQPFTGWRSAKGCCRPWFVAWSVPIDYVGSHVNGKLTAATGGEAREAARKEGFGCGEARTGYRRGAAGTTKEGDVRRHLQFPGGSVRQGGLWDVSCVYVSY